MRLASGTECMRACESVCCCGGVTVILLLLLLLQVAVWKQYSSPCSTAAALPRM